MIIYHIIYNENTSQRYVCFAASLYEATEKATKHWKYIHGIDAECIIDLIPQQYEHENVVAINEIEFKPFN